jgi:hypothetical protein
VAGRSGDPARRRVRRAAAGYAAAVVAVVAVVWAVVPAGTDDAQPADRGRAPGMLRGEDVGPGYQVSGWGRYDPGDVPTEWPPAWLNVCPAFAAAPPVKVRDHLGGHSVQAVPPREQYTSRPVEEALFRFADVAAAGAVLVEARRIATACASYTLLDRSRYTAAVAAEAFAGDDAVRVEMTESGIDLATGGPSGVPAVRQTVLVRVGPVVILVVSPGSTDGAFLQDVARSAVNRWCSETGGC